MSGFAGGLRARVTLLRRARTRDAIGATTDDWAPLATRWAQVAPEGTGPPASGDALAALPRWRVALRARDIAVGDRIGWDGRTIEVRRVDRDPARPDRITAIGEEQR